MEHRSDSPDRLLGDLGEPSRGATLIVVGGVHGNEPAGVRAAHRVAQALTGRAEDLRGRVAFLIGNRAAYREGTRFLDRDLNRAWTQPWVEAVRAGEVEASAEDSEQAELLVELDRLLADSRGRPTYLLDLHTTSGGGGPFTAVADTLDARELALTLPVPLVLGLEEMVDGTLHDYIGRMGVTTIAFESGQHEEPEAVDRAEAAIWLLLEATGLLHPSHIPEAAPSRKLLARSLQGRPRVLEMRYRHGIESSDGFAMDPGWSNFKPVQKGDRVASDAAGRVAAPESGRVLMPLYQAQGEDGFFLVREFSPFWLRVSEAMRMLRLASIVHLMPGIRRHPERPGVYVVNRRVARWYALQLLHLLGFRKVREHGDVLVIERQGRPVDEVGR